MATRERRQPRAFFTRVLSRICERLDQQDTHELTWKERMFPQHEFQGVMRVESLWVVGSYARGATECGDLDIVVKVTCLEGEMAPFTRLKTKALGRSPGLRCYSGDPEENSSRVPFPEAVHIWSRSSNWRDAIASIVEDPHAAHFGRSTDAIPLRGEQLHAGVDDSEEIVRRKRDEEIVWHFLPVDRGNEDPLGTLNDLESHVLERMGFGKRTRELLPHLLRYVRDHRYPMYERYKTYSNAAELALEGTLMVMGRPRIADAALDTLEFSRVLLMPHFSTRGPNGIWELRRGPAHPFEVRMRGIGAYLLETEDGLPSRICRAGSYWRECQSIRLFATERHARQSVAEQQEPALREPTPRWFEGSELLDVLSYADAVEFFTADKELRVLCLTGAGAGVLKDGDDSIKRQSPDSVFAELEEAYSR